MRYTSIVCLVMLLALAGCNKGGGGDSFAGYGGMSGNSPAAGGGLSGGAASSTGYSGAGTTSIPHNPEPATMLLMAGGLAGYALIRRKRKGK